MIACAKSLWRKLSNETNSTFSPFTYYGNRFTSYNISKYWFVILLRYRDNNKITIREKLFPQVFSLLFEVGWDFSICRNILICIQHFFQFLIEGKTFYNLFFCGFSLKIILQLMFQRGYLPDKNNDY